MRENEKREKEKEIKVNIMHPYKYIKRQRTSTGKHNYICTCCDNLKKGSRGSKI